MTPLLSLRGIPNEVRDDEAIWYPAEIATPSARNDKGKTQSDSRRRARNDPLPSLRGILNEVRDDEAIWYPAEIATPSARNDKGKTRSDRKGRVQGQGGKGGIRVVRGWQLGQK